MKTLVTFAFILNFAQGFEILTATLDPPRNPILEGTDVTAKVVMRFEESESWTSCIWFDGEESRDAKDPACKQSPKNENEWVDCHDPTQRSIETFPNLSGGQFDKNLCQLAIVDISSNYSADWIVEIQVIRDDNLYSHTIPITSTKLAEVSGSDDPLQATSGQPFQTSCQASFGVPQPAGFRWLIDNEEGKIEEWNPCLSLAEYGENITQPITLTPPSTGNQGKTEYTLSCVSVQYFDGAENGTLGDFYGEENRADITVIVTEENDKGHNLTNISLPWLIVLIVVCLLLLLFLLLLLWTYCTKTLCFASKDHNNNVKGSQGRNRGPNRGKSNQKLSEGAQGRDIHLVQNNEGKNQNNRNDNKFQDLRVINQYDNHLGQPSRGRDSYLNDGPGFPTRQDYKNRDQLPYQSSRNQTNSYRMDNEGSMAYGNKMQMPISNNPTGITTLRNQIQNSDNFQRYNTNNPGYESSDENIEDEVIYAKPSYDNHARNNRQSSLASRPPKSPRSNKSSSINRNEDWKVEADRASQNNSKSNSLRPNSSLGPTSAYLKKANSVYQNDNLGVPSVSTNPNARHQFQSPSLSRQSSAFSAYSPQKDTLV